MLHSGWCCRQHLAPPSSTLADRPSRTVYVCSQYGHSSSGACTRLRLMVPLREAPPASVPARDRVSATRVSTAAEALRRHCRVSRFSRCAAVCALIGSASTLPFHDGFLHCSAAQQGRYGLCLAAVEGITCKTPLACISSRSVHF